MTLLVEPQPLLLPAPVVLFDLDGTLTDSATGVINGFLHAADTVGFALPTGNLHRLLGPPMRDSLLALGLDEDRIAAGIAAYREYYWATGWAENAVFDGVEPLLDAVRAAGSRLAARDIEVGTFANVSWSTSGSRTYFEFIGGASDDGTRRAKADVVAQSSKPSVTAGGGGTTDVMMVGDREHDIHGAGRWGIPAVFVEWGYGDAPRRRPPPASRPVSTNFARYSRVTADDVLHVTFVCTGNICRSPMAEKIFAEHVRREGLGDRVRVSSAGTHGWHVGSEADPRTNAVLPRPGTRPDSRGRTRSVAPVRRPRGVDDHRPRSGAGAPGRPGGTARPAAFAGPGCRRRFGARSVLRRAPRVRAGPRPDRGCDSRAARLGAAA